MSEVYKSMKKYAETSNLGRCWIDGYEQGKKDAVNDGFKMSVGMAVDTLFSHNSVVALWRLDRKENFHYLLWRGMAWGIPNGYKTMPLVNVFGTIPESITQADTINIEVDLPEAAEAALAERRAEG